MTINTGWTPEISEAERLANEVRSCAELTEQYPNNEYWQNRLAAALVKEYEYHHPVIEAVEIDPDADWLKEPQEAGEATAAAYGLDWPWTDEDLRDEQMNHRPETCF